MYKILTVQCDIFPNLQGATWGGGQELGNSCVYTTAWFTDCCHFYVQCQIYKYIKKKYRRKYPTELTD